MLFSVVAVKSLFVHHHSAVFFFHFLWDHWAHPGNFENRIPLKPTLHKLQCCIWKDSIKPSLQFSWFGVLIVSKSNPFLLIFYSKIQDIRFYRYFPRSGLWAWWAKLAYQVMLTIRGRLITPFILGSMSVGLNILIRHSFTDLWVWIMA